MNEKFEVVNVIWTKLNTFWTIKGELHLRSWPRAS